ncbi:MAG: hypothetical protein K8R88_12290 [Armatimonadetes bacterium]|nr:hypothetical protein [Armatimonadota bacterium]
MAVRLPTRPGGIRWVPPSGCDTAVGYAPDGDASLIYIYVNNLSVASWLEVLMQGDQPGRTVRTFLTWREFVETFMDQEPDMVILDSEKAIVDAKSWFQTPESKAKYVLAMHQEPDMTTLDAMLNFSDVLLMDIPQYLYSLRELE